MAYLTLYPGKISKKSYWKDFPQKTTLNIIFVVTSSSIDGAVAQNMLLFLFASFRKKIEILKIDEKTAILDKKSFIHYLYCFTAIYIVIPLIHLQCYTSIYYLFILSYLFIYIYHSDSCCHKPVS